LPKYSKPRSSKGLATLSARISVDKIASDVVVLDMTRIESSPSDYFVICSCESEIQVKAVVEEIVTTAKQLNISPPRVEGTESYRWALLDFFDVVVHVMLEETRNYYKIEKLWSDASFLDLDSTGAKLKAMTAQRKKEILTNENVSELM
jgi:ribosome-associated protein